MSRVNTLGFKLKIALIFVSVIPLTLYLIVDGMIISKNLTLGLSFLITGLLSIYLSRNIILPIKKLESEINNIRKDNALRFINIKGPREINSLVDSFNKLALNLMEEKKENQRLRILNYRDEITSLYNSRYFFECFQEKITNGYRLISVLIFDIDRFKAVNDGYGREKGDMVLRKISRIVTDTLKGDELAFHFSEDEFIILLQNCNTEKAFMLGETIRTNISNSYSLQKYAVGFPITISCGIACYSADASNVRDLIDKAYKAMNYAKHNGRNQCRVYSSISEFDSQTQAEEKLGEDGLNNIVYTLLAAIEAKNEKLRRHSEAVTRYALKLAEKLGMSDSEKYILTVGALLHDCGKISIPNHIINKEDELNEIEMNIFKSHTISGSNIVKYVINSQEIEACVRSHHECWDGDGYPDGISGNNIPIYARIINIANEYETIRSRKNYNSSSKQEAFNELRRRKGTEFDPDLVDGFIIMIANECDKTD